MRTRLQSLAFALIVLCLSASTALANTSPETDPTAKNELRKEVINLIQNNADFVELEGSAKVSFIVTSKNELVVLDVNTETRGLDKVVKDRLNYKNIKTKGVSKNEPFYVRVTFKQS